MASFNHSPTTVTFPLLIAIRCFQRKSNIILSNGSFCKKEKERVNIFILKERGKGSVRRTKITLFVKIDCFSAYSRNPIMFCKTKIMYEFLPAYSLKMVAVFGILMHSADSASMSCCIF